LISVAFPNSPIFNHASNFVGQSHHQGAITPKCFLFRHLGGFSFALDAMNLTLLSVSGPVYPELNDRIGLAARDGSGRESRTVD